jgi:mRNA interferase MazF
MRKGEIWWADLPKVGLLSEPGKRRPVLVIQNDDLNESNISTVVCAAITSNTALANMKPNLLLEKKVSGLPKSSTINFSQIVTLDKTRFLEEVSMLPKTVLTRVDDSIRHLFAVG